MGIFDALGYGARIEVPTVNGADKSDALYGFRLDDPRWFAGAMALVALVTVCLASVPR